jgi:hypothetical protein
MFDSRDLETREFGVTNLFFRQFYGFQILLESLKLTGLAWNYGNQDLKGENQWRCPPRKEDLRTSYIFDNLKLCMFYMGYFYSAQSLASPTHLDVQGIAYFLLMLIV